MNVRRASRVPTLTFCVAILLVAAAVASGAFQTPPAQKAEAGAGERKERDLPLDPTRTISFTTDEGSWISLDVSPDGRTILFELLGDLYTLPIGGGEATRITDGLAFDTQPRYSPDGRTVAFVSDRNGADNLWIANADGSDPKPLTRGKDQTYRSPEWTPDGKYLVVSKIAGPEGMHLWLHHVDGGSGVRLTGHPDDQRNLAPHGPAFGKDPRYLYFSERTSGNAIYYNQTRFRWQLAVYDRQTGEVFRQSDEWGSGMRPTLSPDGKWLVYATRWDARTGLRLRNLDTGDDAWLVYPVQRDDQESANTRDLMPGSSFTPDSGAFITSFDGKIWRVDIPSGRMAPIPFTAKVEQKLGPLVKFEYQIPDGPVRARQIRHPRLSPDGKQLAFTALDRVYVMDYPNGTPRRVSSLTVGEHQPAWSPDGRFITYVTWSDAEGGHVYRTPADGGEPQRLTEVPSFYSVPVYSLDGQRIVLVRGPRVERQEDFSPLGRGGQALEVVWLPAGGGRATLIAPYRGPGRPHFGADRDRIYVWEVRTKPGQDGPPSASGELVSFRFDGTDRRAHAKVTGWKPPTARDAQPASEVLMGPDGDHAIVETQRHVYLIDVPVAGGEPPTISVAKPDDASVPVLKLTTVGGEFLDWAEGGRAVTFALGRTLFRYDVRLGRAAAEKARAERDARRDRPEKAGAVDRAQRDRKPVYEAAETEVIVEVPRPRPKGTVVLRGARIITMKNAGERLRPTPSAEARGVSERGEAPLSTWRLRPRYRQVEWKRAGGAFPAERWGPASAEKGPRGSGLERSAGFEVIERGDVVVTDNRIAAVGKRGQVSVPAGATIIDVAGKTVMPGIVDVHAHIWPAWQIHRTQVWEYLANLAYGVTTTRDPQTSTTDILTYRDLVEAGGMLGPRVYGTGPGVFRADDVQSLDDARDILRRYSKYWDTETIKQYMVGNRQQRQWIAIAAKEQGLTPTLEGGLDLKLNLTQILDGYSGLEHTLPIMPLFQDVVRLAADSGLTYTPTLLVQYGGPWAENHFFETTDVHGDPKMRKFTPHRELDENTLRRSWFHEQEYSFPMAAKVLADILKAGGRVGLGGHGQQQGIQCHWELWAMTTGGISNADALKVATIYGAEAIGFGKEIGSLEKGKLADLIVLDRNPLENIRHTTSIRYVMKNGELYDADTLDQVWPQKKSLPRPYWWDHEPPVRPDAPPRPSVRKPPPTNGQK